MDVLNTAYCLDIFPFNICNTGKIKSLFIRRQCIGFKFICSFIINNLFKVELSLSKKNYIIYFIESPLKIMKNAFYLILNALFLLKIFKLLS